MPVAGGDTFKLSDITVSSGSVDAKGMDKYMNPLTEYIQHLSADGTASVDGRYTYVSEAYLKKQFANWEDYKDAIGWWNWVKQTNYKTKIQNHDYALKCTDAQLEFDVGDAFLGAFSGANDLKFTSSGAVNTEAFPITVGSAKSPYFVISIPRAIDINEMSVVSGSVDAKGMDKYMNPLTEYIQHLSADGTASVDGRYTYVSEAYLKKQFTNWEDYKDAIGWWNWVKQTNYKTKIQNHDYELKITTKELAVGDSFLGAFSGANDLIFKFPAATESAID